MILVTEPSILATQVATLIANAFDAYHRKFKEITRNAQQRFEQQDWYGSQSDSIERLDIYRLYVDCTLDSVRTLLGNNTYEKTVWQEAKIAYTSLIVGHDDYLLGETFYNSVVRHLYNNSEVDPTCEFVEGDIAPPPLDPTRPMYRRYSRQITTAMLIQQILKDYSFNIPYLDIERDARQAAELIDAELLAVWQVSSFEQVEIATPVFFRNKGAYLVGRIIAGEQVIPLVLSLLNESGGVVVDTVIMTQDGASIVFSFTRSYFEVELDRPHELVDFLRSIMPRKKLSELYTSLGYNKHGKTELYRGLLRVMGSNDEMFETARGEKGLVMIVFTMPTLDVVFKVIRDRFGPPKTTTRRHVLDRYQLVFRHDRAGRLADAQEFEYLRFEKARFKPDILKELLTQAANTVTLDGDTVVIKHLYTERKMAPLNLYVREVDAEKGKAAVIDFGQAIKDLAATNIFPGDVLLKNFGVTRHGRVVFYDYDELCLLTDCNFREMPQAQSDDDDDSDDDGYSGGWFDEEYSAEPWFYVAENDIFPEELRKFLGLPPTLRDTFFDAHGDLFGVEFWHSMQARHQAGEVMDLFPYSHAQRLRK